MKKLLSLVFALFFVSAHAATLVPIQLLNPTGSTSGQAIVSTGASSAPGWVSVAGTAGSTFTGLTGVGYSNPIFFVNDTSGTNKAFVVFEKTGTNVWDLSNTSSTGVFALDRYNGGTYVDSPITVSNSTGAVTAVDGITNSPISGSTGSFTTLAASSTVSGAGFSTYLASPPCIGCTTAAAGVFTTLNGLTLALTNSATAGSTISVTSASNTTNGASITLNGNGGTTPNKSIRAFSGQFQVVNSAASAVITSIDDSGDLVASGSITPSQTGGIVGTTTNNSAQAGSVGEYISSTIASGSALGLTTGTAANVTSISLTAGDWDVWGAVQFTVGASTVQTAFFCAVSGGSATLVGGQTMAMAGLPTGQVLAGGACPQIRVTATGATTMYLVAEAVFGTSTVSAYGFIAARRRR